MGLKTKIEYLAKGGSTHNFWSGGCEPISEGCGNCFAKRIYERFYGKDFSVPIKSKNFDAPLKWKKPRVILVNDMSDFFYPPLTTNWQIEAFNVMFDCSQHIFLLLTKRPKNIKHVIKFLDKYRNMEFLSKNIWLGVSVENQKNADERIPELLKIPHFKKWLSIEPLLEEIDIYQHLKGKRNIKKGIDWVVCGAETGKSARYMEHSWASRLILQCKNAGVPFFMKQISNKAPIPKDLMVREYPPEIERIIKLYENNSSK